MAEAEALPEIEAIERALEASLEPHLVRQFARYLELLRGANQRAGLTSLEDPSAIVERHFAESVALLALMREHPWTREALAVGARVADLGAGGGFPGVPMRLVEPRMQLTLIEAHGRRAGFLEELVAQLDLGGVEVVRARAEETGRDPAYRGAFDVVTARAVAPLAVLVEYAVPLLRRGGVLVTPKGSGAPLELAEAETALDALGAEAAEPVALPRVEAIPPPTVLLVRRTRAVLDERYPRRPGIPSKRPLRS